MPARFFPFQRVCLRWRSPTTRRIRSFLMNYARNQWGLRSAFLRTKTGHGELFSQPHSAGAAAAGASSVLTRRKYFHCSTTAKQDPKTEKSPRANTPLRLSETCILFVSERVPWANCARRFTFLVRARARDRSFVYTFFCCLGLGVRHSFRTYSTKRTNTQTHTQVLFCTSNMNIACGGRNGAAGCTGRQPVG